MNRTIKISASYTGKISTGSYENESPFCAVEETMEGVDLTDKEIAERQRQLQAMCFGQFKEHAELAKSERIAREYQNIRFYPGKNGKKYPSVTSIIGWDKDFFMKEEELTQHAARGTVIDKQVEVFLNTGEWKDPMKIPEIYPEIVILRKGNLHLEIDNVDFQAFYKEYPFKVISQQTTVLNHEVQYGGRMEIKCIIESENKGGWDKIKGVIFDVPTLLDLKATTSLDKTYVMKQNTAYAKCDKEIQQIGAIHLKKDNAQGYAKPVLCQDLDKYWTLFIRDRENFKRRYGL